jgi:hypothetical protein
MVKFYLSRYDEFKKKPGSFGYTRDCLVRNANQY